MEKQEFENKVRKIAFLVIGFIAWALVVLVLDYVVSSSGMVYLYGYFVELFIFSLLMVGAYLVINRIYVLVFTLDESEEQDQE